MVKKLVILAIAALVAYGLVKWVPAWIESKRHAQSEQLNKMETHAQRRAEDMVGSGPNKVDKAIGGSYGQKAIENSDKANMRSYDTLRKMEEEEGGGEGGGGGEESGN